MHYKIIFVLAVPTVIALIEGGLLLQQEDEIEALKSEMAELARAADRIAAMKVSDLRGKAQARLDLPEVAGAQDATPPRDKKKTLAERQDALSKDGMELAENPNAVDPTAVPANQKIVDAANQHLRAQMLRKYGDLIKRLALTPDATEAFTKMLVDRKQSASDVAAATIQSGGDPSQDLQTTSDLAEAERIEIEGEIKALLGPEKYNQYLDYDRSLGQAGILSLVQQSLKYEAVPLNDYQSRMLQQTLEQNHVGHLNDKVISGLAPYLNPTQLQTLHKISDEQQSAAKLRLVSPGPVASGVPPPPRRG